ncbi:MAG: hypothetical protein P8J14_09410, partial [Emcibacteraceae bacterium]|nr:hypothetical protein [Emcibacteraceae bacterium]
MLTKKQHTLLMLIHERLQKDGVAPSFEEMKIALELKSKSGIHRLINALEERGFIRRLANRARALEVIKLPEDEETVSSSNNLFKPNFGGAAQDVDPDTIEIPLHGKIAAGTPIEALEQYENIGVPATMLGGGSYYALDVDGDSMLEA